MKLKDARAAVSASGYICQRGGRSVISARSKTEEKRRGPSRRIVAACERKSCNIFEVGERRRLVLFDGD